MFGVDVGYMSYIVAATHSAKWSEYLARWYSGYWALDSHPIFRLLDYKDYKVSREAQKLRRPELSAEVERLRKEIAESRQLVRVVKTGYEADDLLSALAARGDLSFIVGVDKDYYLAEMVWDQKFCDLSGSEILVSERFLKKLPKWAERRLLQNSSPENFLVTHALFGDSSDDVPRIIYQRDAEIFERILQRKTLIEKIEEAQTLSEKFLINLNLVMLPHYSLMGYESSFEAAKAGFEDWKERLKSLGASELGILESEDLWR